MTDPKSEKQKYEAARELGFLEGKIEGLELSINVQSMDERGEYLKRAKAALAELKKELGIE